MVAVRAAQAARAAKGARGMADSAEMLAALIIGLGSSAHCMGMCGGIAAGFGGRNTKVTRQNSFRSNLLFNAGRLLTYTLLGVIAGLLTNMLPGHLSSLQLMIRIAAGLMLVLMGLYLSGWWPVLTHLEKMAMPLWTKVQPAIRSVTKGDSKYRSMQLGVLWGLLPCGLVYSSLIWASSSGSAITAGLLMLFMGIGTLPALLSLGFAGAQLIRTSVFRRMSGLTLICYGVWTSYMPLQSLLSSTPVHH